MGILNYTLLNTTWNVPSVALEGVVESGLDEWVSKLTLLSGVQSSP